ncbi:MAG: pseudouridine synthase [Lachnospiraceae bacterium]|nr:pseudouridine synthase [Lachnospiraceae bacterium]
MQKDYINEIEESMRINKFLSDAGYCSRREADKLIEAGRVFIDGIPAKMGDRVTKDNEVSCNGQVIKREEELILLAFNKPKGVVCTTTDKHNEVNIVDYINYKKRIYPVGRLDKDSEGLILMTNDGYIVNKILKGSNMHEKEYVVKVNKDITDAFIKGMSSGVPILDTVTRKCKVEAIDKRTFRIILTQGLNRQIRRMCEHFDYKVTALKRVRIMNINLGKLSTGKYRELSKNEIDELIRQL